MVSSSLLPYPEPLLVTGTLFYMFLYIPLGFISRGANQITVPMKEQMNAQK